ncbi:MAG: helix-turn-helix domain-containing protein, partial [Actinomycetota bacterium]
MPSYPLRAAAQFLGVSDDTLRRWADAGRLPTRQNDSGRRVIDGAELARFAQQLSTATPRPEAAPVVLESARNRFVGLVTRVVRDTVMA